MMVRIFKHFVPGQLLVLALVEAIVLFSSMYLGVSLRFIDGDAIDLKDIVPIWPKALVFTLVMLGVLTAFGLYQRHIPRGNWSFYARFIGGFMLGLAIMTLIFYVVPGLFLGRGAFGLTFLFALTGTAIARYAFFQLVDHEVLKRRILVLGTGSRAAKVKEMIDTNAEVGGKFRLVGYVAYGQAGHYIDKSVILDDKRSLLSLAARHEVDEIVMGIRERRASGLSMSELLECKLEGVNVIDLVSFFERETGQVQLDSLNPSWMVFSDGFSKGTFTNISKRIFDISISCMLLVITLPIMLIAAALIFLESGMPILYRQERVGECGRTFKLLKFRSMRNDAEQDGVPQWAKANDSRVTLVGRVIRTTRIDELPQIFNVLKGDMSFVGPRPERPYFVGQLAQQIPYFASRHAVKPGITGWAQIRYPYGSSVDDAVQKLQYDLYYVKNHSLFLDLIILLQTAQVVLFGKGAR